MESFNKKIAFIGCGNMGSALAAAVSEAGFGENLMFCDHTMKKAEGLAASLGGCAANVQQIAKEGYFIFLGVKPQGLEELFEEIAPVLSQRKDKFVLVTMAAGVSIQKIQQLSGCGCPVIRIMPNTPVLVGEGIVLYCSNHLTENNDIHLFVKLLSKAGMVDPVPEEKIDGASALTGCGPAFAYIFAEALADGAVECGLQRDKAAKYAAQMLLGSAKMLLESGKHPGKLKDEVCSPGGTTIAGVHALENGAFRGIASDAVVASYLKTLNLKK